MATVAYGTLVFVVRAFWICEAHLSLGSRPILQVDLKARVFIAGQALIINATNLKFHITKQVNIIWKTV